MKHKQPPSTQQPSAQKQSAQHQPTRQQQRKGLLSRASFVLALVVASFSAALVALALYLLVFDYRGDADQRSRAEILSIYRAMDTSDPEARASLADVLAEFVVEVEYVPAAQPQPSSANALLAQAVINNLSFRLNQGTTTQLALTDGNTIRISHQALSSAGRPSLWIAAAVLVLLLLIAVLLWAATRYLSPVQKVVDAADQLSLERDLAPINEADGPALARDAAKAFNRMQARIKEYLGERSLMIHALHHDLRHGMFKLQMRMEQVDDEGIKSKSLRDINDLLEVLEEVLAFADTDLGPDRRQNIRVNSLVFGAVDMFVDQGRGIEVDLSGPHTVFANQTRLKRVIGNLVGNAMTYADRLWITSQPLEDSYNLIFDDDGPGIPKHERTRVLQPFQRLDKSRNRNSGGTGLGLAIVKRSIDRDQGGLELLDSPHGGLRVVLTLPRPSPCPEASET